VAHPSPDLLDARGVLREGAEVPPAADGFLVLGQATPPPFDIATLRAYASRFLGAKLGLSAEKRGEAPAHDLAFVLVHHEGVAATVAVEARASTEADRALARRAEGGARAGLGDLAARCPRAFVVHAAPGEARAALLVACVLAGTSLGPIVHLDGSAIYGVKSARERLSRG